MKMMIFMSTMINIMFITTKQPMKMVIMILMQTLVSTFMMSMKTKSTWFPYMLMIIFIGGMMVLFIYITSITPNEKSKTNPMIIISMMTMMAIFMLKYKNMKNMYYTNETNIMEINSILSNQMMFLNKIFNKPMYMLSIMMMMYLFIALIAVNKISNMKKGPLRKMN
uniref:NADH-ubiquinone oxidoreductase chain 6 n=1 Tax=Ergatettix serrifemora TaxID=2740434 RepID=A0A7G7WR03_9ORTH|nr:NADH dehydrogenase subunit 6 [Ergatettix serrifemora]